MIPFNKPAHLGTETERIREAIVQHGQLAGGGPFGRECEALLTAKLGRPTLVVSSCSHALEMAALLLDLSPGDEVILPSYAFVTSASAFALRGAQCVFADVDLNGNIDPAEVEALLGPRTRAVVALHYAGNSCDMDHLLSVCGRVPVIEDAAQALGARFAGRPLGGLGALGTVSFHETKNVGCGEGGALAVGDANLLERAEIIRDKGTNRQRFLAGLEDKYTWVDVGSSYSLAELNAAFLYEQLTALERIQERRREIHTTYTSELATPLAEAGLHVLAPHPANTPNFHLFGVVFPHAEQRRSFIDFMSERGIMTPFHYVALHRSPMGRKHHPSDRPLPRSDWLSDGLVRLPLFYNMTDAELDEVISRMREYLSGH